MLHIHSLNMIYITEEVNARDTAIISTVPHFLLKAYYIHVDSPSKPLLAGALSI